MECTRHVCFFVVLALTECSLFLFRNVVFFKVVVTTASSNIKDQMRCNGEIRERSEEKSTVLSFLTCLVDKTTVFCSYTQLSIDFLIEVHILSSNIYLLLRHRHAYAM